MSAIVDDYTIDDVIGDQCLFEERLFKKMEILNKILSNSLEETLTVKIKNLLGKIIKILEDYSFEELQGPRFLYYCYKLVDEVDECEKLFRIYEENNTYVLPTLKFVD
jgi:hypothetical protein